METGRNDRFCGSNGGADIGVFGMMSSVILTVQLIINIINARNNWQWGLFHVLCIFISVTTTTITTIITTMIISEQSLSPFYLNISVLLFCFSNNNLNDNSMVSIMAGPGQNMNMNNVGRAFPPHLEENVKMELYSCKKRLGMTDILYSR